MMWTRGPCPHCYRRMCPTYRALDEGLDTSDYLEVVRVLRERCHGESGGCLRRRQFEKEEESK